MLYYILGGMLALIAVIAIVVARKPGAFRIERAATFNAPPAAVFAQLNDFHYWRAWSPWERMDPELNRTYEGAPEGVGAVYSWAGNKQVGEGRMTILESRPNELVRIKLEFFKPFTATNVAEFTLQPKGQQTTLTWAMAGTRSCCMKAMCMVMDMDKMVGGDFEKGLANMKSVVEVK